LKKFFAAFAILISVCAPVFSQPIIDETETSIETQLAILRERQAGIRRAKTILETVFAFDGSTPDVRLSMPDMKDRLHGSYAYWNRLIAINNRHQASSYAALITFHEVGHWFDNRVLAPRFLPGAPESVFASETRAPEMAAYRAAIKNSRTYRGLQSLLESKNTAKNSAREAYLKYVMSDSEMFARSFCAYVAAKSNDAEIQRQMKIYTENDWPWNGAFYPDDFKPIEKSLDELFSKNGWLKPAKNQTTN
jgi:hypothetical protein